RGPRLPRPARRQRTERGAGGRDEDAPAGEPGAHAARGADEELDQPRRPGHRALRQPDGRRRGRGRQALTLAVSAGSDTIFALATPPGRGAVAVVRLSGPRSA